MQAKSMEELRSMLLKETKKALDTVSQKALADLYEGTGSFYTQGTPKVYQRTGALGNTPRVTSLRIDGNSVSLEVYLETNYRYTVGQKPTMLDVLNQTNYGILNSSVGYLNPALGKQGYWEESLKKIESDFESTMRKFFRNR